MHDAAAIIETDVPRAVITHGHADPTCPAFEPQRCDVFITGATFGLPVFRRAPTLVATVLR